jgi:hypothetical protein
LKIIGHEKPDNKLESHGIFMGIHQGSKKCPLPELSMLINITTKDNDNG